MIELEGSCIKLRRSRSKSFTAQQLCALLDRHLWTHWFNHYEDEHGKTRVGMICFFKRSFATTDEAKKCKIELERALTSLGAGFRWDRIDLNAS